MTHINLDGQPEAVKQFFLALPADPEGAVVERNGRAVARIVPAEDTGGKHPADEPWAEAKNARRCALIDREIDGTLTPDEAAELRRLQQAMLRHRRRVAPLPLADARRLHQELLAKVGRPGGGASA
jgi:hypothetical protein